MHIHMSVIRVHVTEQTSSCSFSELCDSFSNFFLYDIFHIDRTFFFCNGFFLNWETNQYKNKVLVLFIIKIPVCSNNLD